MSWIIIGSLFAVLAVVRANSIVNRACKEEHNIPENTRKEISTMTIYERLAVLDSLYFKKDQFLTPGLLCLSTISFTFAGAFYGKGWLWMALFFLLLTVIFALTNYIASKKFEIH